MGWVSLREDIEKRSEGSSSKAPSSGTGSRRRNLDIAFHLSDRKSANEKLKEEVQTLASEKQELERRFEIIYRKNAKLEKELEATLAKNARRKGEFERELRRQSGEILRNCEKLEKQLAHQLRIRRQLEDQNAALKQRVGLLNKIAGAVMENPRQRANSPQPE
ncbi:hypothetical protein [Mesorhizobium sp. CN2-181]|uniref:hypothetical protein n=1 Tax=Mesorhizobium yinganensis TaxID=3157707 RepID=UPI0032B7B94F